MRLFYESTTINDATTYLNNLIKKFKKKFNLATTKIILENYKRKGFAYEIDDDLFKQFYLQSENVSDHSYPISQNSKQSLYSAYAQFHHTGHQKQHNRTGKS